MDESFLNQAWEQMRATLDRELPVQEEKRRRVLFVPWRPAAAASVLLLLTVALLWWSQQAQTTAPVADASRAVSTPNDVATAEEDCDDISQAPVWVQKEQQEAKITIENGRQKAFIAAKERRSKVDKVQTNGTNTGMTATAAVLQPESAVFNPTFPAESAATILRSNTTGVLQANALQSLTARQIALLENEKLPADYDKPLPLLMPESTATTSGSKWKIGLELATYASPNAALDGYAGGAVVDVPIQSEKFNFRTGLNFNAQQRYFDVEVETGIESADRGGNAGFGPSNVIVDPQPNLSVNAQQLSLPLTLEFKPRKSWGLEGGLQASYLLGAQNLKGAEAYQTMTGLQNGNEEVTNFVYSLTNKSADRTGVVTFDSSSDSDNLNLRQLRRFDVALTAGVGVYPTKNIGVRLQYQRGLVDLLKADQFKTFGNNVRLSAVYFFK